MKRLPTPEQLREAELDGETYAYNVAQGSAEEWQCRYDGALDPECFRAFWASYDRTLRRSPLLRTVPASEEATVNRGLFWTAVVLYGLLLIGFAAAIAFGLGVLP